MQQSTIKTLVDWSFRTLAGRPSSISGRKAGPSEQVQCQTALVLWGVLLTETTGFSFNQIRPFLGRAYSTAGKDIIGFITELDSARMALLRCSPDLLNAGLSAYIPNLKSRFMDAIGGNPLEFRNLNCIFSFLRKIEIARPDLEDQAIQSYLQLEKEAIEAELPESMEWVYSEMNRIIKEWFGDFHIRDYRPHHGPGRVAEPGLITIYDKYSNLANVPTVGRLLSDLGLDPLRSYVPELFRWRISHHTCDAVARFGLVPKTYKALRGIAPQPDSLQWVQKGVQDPLYKYIERNPYLNRIMPLRHQERNADLARQGSLTNRFATIDLSHASDSVSLKLVERLFANTELLRWQIATRATHVKVKQQIIPAGIFAGMGSSLCFPTETIIFAAACELIKQHGYAILPDDEIYSVFGDDIVIPTRWARPLMWLLPRLGFTVNEEKSFINGPFRESCGMEAFMGYDVTPIRYPFHCSPLPPLIKGKSSGKSSKRKRNANAIIAADGCQFANRAILEYGFVDLRFATIYVLQRFGYSGFVFTDDLYKTAMGSSAPHGCLTFYSYSASNAHLPTRVNETYCKQEWKGLTIHTYFRRRLGAQCEELRLWEWLRCPPREDIELDPYALQSTSVTHLSRRWVGRW